MENRGYTDGIVRYPISVIDHIKQSQDPASEDVAELKEWKEQQESAVPDNVIKGIREMENFLKNIPDTETLTQLLSALTTSLNTAIAARYTKPQGGIPKSDLTTEVQASLAKADSALQSHQSLTGYATEQWVENKGYLTEHQDISGKANVSDVYTKQAVDEADQMLQTFAMLMPALAQTTYSTVSVVSNPEYKVVLTDSEDKIIAGIRQDNTYTGLPIGEAIDAILEVIDDINNAS